MRKVTLLYKCMMGNSKVHLAVDHLHVADFPISYTPQECLEEFCERVGWEFLGYEADSHLFSEITFSFQLKCPIYTNIDRILIEAHYPLRLRGTVGSSL